LSLGWYLSAKPLNMKQFPLLALVIGFNQFSNPKQSKLPFLLSDWDASLKSSVAPSLLTTHMLL
jgi:hypothetical protein